MVLTARRVKVRSARFGYTAFFSCKGEVMRAQYFLCVLVSGLLVGCGFKSDLSIPDDDKGLFVNDALPEVQSSGVEVGDDIFVQPGSEEVEVDDVRVTEALEEQVSLDPVDETDDGDDDGVPVDLTELLGNKK